MNPINKVQKHVARMFLCTFLVASWLTVNLYAKQQKQAPAVTYKEFSPDKIKTVESLGHLQK
jgi:hypothetical protein